MGENYQFLLGENEGLEASIPSSEKTMDWVFELICIVASMSYVYFVNYEDISCVVSYDSYSCFPYVSFWSFVKV